MNHPRQDSSGFSPSADESALFRILQTGVIGWEYWILPDGSIGYCSDSCRKLTGYDAAQIKADPGLLRRMVMDEDLPLWDRHGHASPTEDVREFSFRLRCSDGQILWVQHRCSPVCDPAGHFAGFRVETRDISERKRVETVLRERVQVNDALIRAMPDMFFVLSVEGTIFEVKADNDKDLAFPRDQLVGRSIRDAGFPEETLNKVLDSIRRCAESGRPVTVEYSLNTLGGLKDFEARIVPLSLTQVLAVVRNITERKELERHQQTLTAGLRTVVSIADELIVCTDMDTFFRRAVELARDRLGLERCAIFVEEGEFMRCTYGTDRFGRTTNEWAHRFLKDEEWKKRLASLPTQDPRWIKIETPFVEWDGEKEIPFGRGWIAVTPIRSTHGPVGVFVNDTAITGSPLDTVKQDVLAVFCSLLGNIAERKWAEGALKESEERFRYISFHDGLTGLYNRTFFEEEMARIGRDIWRFMPLSILLIDLDGLKLVNDTFGHKFGDDLLVTAARILKKSFRSVDIISRVGGDEFCVILPGLDYKGALEKKQNILRATEEYNAEQPMVPMSMSIGVASSRQGQEENIYDIYQRADNNMYEYKLSQPGIPAIRVVEMLLAALSERDFVALGHAERLTRLAEQMADRLNLPEKVKNDLILLAKIHDLGKVGIPDEILFCPRKLTAEEYDKMKNHSQIGYNIASRSKELAHIADLVLHHHENWDGRGYPARLKGEQIPLECRVLALIDAYDAMTNDRPHHSRIGKDEAVAELRRCSGSQFDPALTEIFIELLESEPETADRTA